ncbi:hypothetical protein [Pseudomonas sp. B21-053]|uniref:hypothetical protein n=1 Tax=Pseudomonas sp. B21-053 TaxID=2895493 RepID=UPI0022310701|nr:hypothetical protein [Pseudomonas sp. B21-053]UZE09643.1 hypothetical protein LOY68_19225 [Pseudomonas sp. B21-053]
MDVRLQAGIIAFVAAIIATAITAYVNFYLARKKSEQEKALLAGEILRVKREETLKNLYLLSTKISITKLDMASGPSALTDFNKNYDNINEHLAEITMSLTLYFPAAKKVFDPIGVEAAEYWKNFKNHLVSPTQPPNPIFMQSAITAIQHSDSIISRVTSSI